MSEDETRRCARRDRCYTAERDDDDRLIGGPTNRPLCDVCEQAVAYALEDAPYLYVRIREATLTRPIGARAADLVHISRGSPLPLNGRAMDLGEQLHWLLTTWEDEVRSIAQLTPPDRDGKREGRHLRRGRPVTEPTARERLAERLCEAALHVHLIDENASWQAMWLRVADVALVSAREEVLGPVLAALHDLTEAVSRGDEYGLPEAYRNARRAIAEAGGDE